jgi:hypothetical protein
MVISTFALHVVPSRRFFPGRRHPLPLSIPVVTLLFFKLFVLSLDVVFLPLPSATGRRLPPSALFGAGFLPRLPDLRPAAFVHHAIHRIQRQLW